MAESGACERLEPLVANVDAPRATLSWFHISRLLGGDDEDDAPFQWSASKARAWIGLSVLRELSAATEDRRHLTPLDAVNRVVDRRVAVGREGWADREGAKLDDWLCSIGDGGRAAVIREAVTWVTACRTQLKWPPHDIWERDEGSCYVNVRDEVLTLSTAIHLGSWKAPGIIDPNPPTPHTRAALGFIALVRTMKTGALPDRVTALHLASGDRTRVVTTDDVLEEVVDLCAWAISRWAERV